MKLYTSVLAIVLVLGIVSSDPSVQIRRAYNNLDSTGQESSFGKRAGKGYNLQETQKLLKSPLWDDLFKGQSPSAKKIAEEKAIDKANNADNSDSKLSDSEAKKRASDRTTKLKSKLEMIYQ